MDSSKFISVLIANFDWDVSNLIIELHKQLIETKFDFEILCYDNSKESSFEQKNTDLNRLENVNYRLEHEFFGRSQNRNKLATDAKGEWLLFLDGDSQIKDHQFIEKYIDASSKSMVVCGGTAYAEKPNDTNNILRWTYGKEREQISAFKRNIHPNSGFSSFNFLIKKEAFDLIGFNNNLTQYGHEDTLFGIELEEHHFTILHIDNPLLHLGLDSNNDFLIKTKQALENLKLLVDSKTIKGDSKLVSYYLSVSRLGLKPVVKSVFKKYSQRWEKALCTENPKMKTFDLYRLGYLCSL